MMRSQWRWGILLPLTGLWGYFGVDRVIRGLVTAHQGLLTLKGEHGEKGFHIRFGPEPKDLIILAPRLAPGSSKSHPCSLSLTDVGKTRVRSAEILVNGGFFLLQAEKKREGDSDPQISAAVAEMEGKPYFSYWSSMMGFNP